VTHQQRWKTIPEMVLSAADRFGDAEAVVDGPRRLTFTEVVERIRFAAGAFADRASNRVIVSRSGRPIPPNG
jgi:HIP---CoA ligase